MKILYRTLAKGLCGIGMANGLYAIYHTNPPYEAPRSLDIIDAQKIDGQMLSQQELESLYLRYRQLIKDRRPVANEYAELKDVAENQLKNLKKQLPEKLAMLDKSRVYLKRLEANENIGRINDVIARIEDSSISAEVISKSFSDTFAREEKKAETIKSEEREELKSLYED